MADAPAPAPAPAKKGWLRAAVVGVCGLFGGTATMYVTAVFDSVVKPPKPVANFGTKVDGLAVTLEHKAIGDSGWWDFGDGSPLEPFDPNQATLAHTYAKPGTYSVKLTVRNFVMDENDRTVPVELGTAGAPAALPPSVTGLTVVPVGSTSVAPATFKIVGQVRNADKTMINTTAGLLKETNVGVVEELVVIDTPGPHTVDLIATSAKGGSVKQTAHVTVTAPTVGSLAAYVRVLDAGTKTDREPYAESVAVVAPTKQNPQKSFEKRLAPTAGFVFKEVTVGGVTNKAATNVRVELDKTGTSARVLGDWSGTPNVGEVFVTLKGTQERQVTLNPKETRATGEFVAGRAVVKIPKRPEWMGQGARLVYVELTETLANGSRSVMAPETVPPTGPMVRQIQVAGRAAVATMQLNGDSVEFLVR
jgi:PKD repeat protein